MPTLPNIDGVAQYLYWLCGKFQLQARNLVPGSPVTPLPPFTPMPNPIEFVVGVGTPILNGGSTLVIPQFIGYNVTFDRNNLPQTQLNSQPTFYMWNKVTGLFTVSPAAVTDELFSINPV